MLTNTALRVFATAIEFLLTLTILNTASWPLLGDVIFIQLWVAPLANTIYVVGVQKKFSLFGINLPPSMVTLMLGTGTVVSIWILSEQPVFKIICFFSLLASYGLARQASLAGVTYLVPLNQFLRAAGMLALVMFSAIDSVYVAALACIFALVVTGLLRVMHGSDGYPRHHKVSHGFLQAVAVGYALQAASYIEQQFVFHVFSAELAAEYRLVVQICMLGLLVQQAMNHLVLPKIREASVHGDIMRVVWRAGLRSGRIVAVFYLLLVLAMIALHGLPPEVAYFYWLPEAVASVALQIIAFAQSINLLGFALAVVGFAISVALGPLLLAARLVGQNMAVLGAAASAVIMKLVTFYWMICAGITNVSTLAAISAAALVLLNVMLLRSLWSFRS